MPTNRRPRGESVLLLRSSGLNLVGGVLQSAGGFLVIVLLERLLPSTSALGALLTAVAATNLAAQLGQLGVGTGLVRFVAKSHGSLQQADVLAVLQVGLLPAVVASTLIALLVGALADGIAPWISDDGSEGAVAVYLRWFAMMVPVVAVLNSVAQATRAFGTMGPAVLQTNVVRPGLQIVGLGLLLAVGATSLREIAVAYWLPSLVAAFGIVLAIRRSVLRLPRRTATEDVLRRTIVAPFWRFTAPRAIASVFSGIVEWGDALLLAGLSSTADAGIYTASTRFLIVGRTVQLAAVNALRPQINRLLEDGQTEEAQQTYRLAATWSVTLAWPWFLGVATFADELLGLLSPDFVVAATAVRVLCAGWLLGTILGPVSAVLEMAGRSTWSMLDLGLAMVVNLALNILLIPRFGLTGAAVAWTASIAVNNVLPAWQVALSTGMMPLGSTTRRVAAMALATFGGLALLDAALPGGQRDLAVVAASLVVVGAAYLVLVSKSVPGLDVRELVERIRRGSRGGQT